MSAKLDTLVKEYIQLRDHKKEMEADFKEKVAPLKERMERLEAGFLNAMHKTGVESLRTAHGTVYTSQLDSASVEDWEEALKYIIAHDLWHLLERRVSKTGLADFVEENGSPIPGTKLRSAITVRIRRS